jgi:hypothetical protein
MNIELRLMKEIVVLDRNSICLSKPYVSWIILPQRVK